MFQKRQQKRNKKKNKDFVSNVRTKEENRLKTLTERREEQAKKQRKKVLIWSFLFFSISSLLFSAGIALSQYMRPKEEARVDLSKPLDTKDLTALSKDEKTVVRVQDGTYDSLKKLEDEQKKQDEKVAKEKEAAAKKAEQKAAEQAALDAQLKPLQDTNAQLQNQVNQLTEDKVTLQKEKDELTQKVKELQDELKQKEQSTSEKKE